MPTYIPDMRPPKCCGDVGVSVVYTDGIVTWRCWNSKCGRLLTTRPTVIPDDEPIDKPVEIPRESIKSVAQKFLDWRNDAKRTRFDLV